MEPVRFEIAARDPASRARAGILHTPHGSVETPAFAPVGTHGTVKGLSPRDLQDVGVSIVMSNAYHLGTRPGAATIRELGGLHRFSGWSGPMMTDSGGFQVFSLADLREVDDDGVSFREPLDGSLRRITPESVMETQQDLGADIVFPLDVCTPYPVDAARADADLQRTQRWAARSLDAHTRSDQALYGIVQGATFDHLRALSARGLAEMGFDGFGIGGVSVGEPKAEMYAAVEAAVAELPDGAPRHLLGVGYPEDLVEGVARGADTFDCVMPTRVARNGGALTMGGRVNLRNATYAVDDAPIDVDCDCYACENFTRGALRHWLKAGEILPLQLLTLHNVRFLARLVEQIRQAILEGRFPTFRTGFVTTYSGGYLSRQATA